MIARVLMTGVIAGLVAGLAVAALQHVTTTPLILAAEVYETAQHAHDGAEAGDALSGLSRTAATSVATVAVSIGYALILLAAMLLSGDAIAPRRAALWGACAFAATGLATSSRPRAAASRHGGNRSRRASNLVARDGAMRPAPDCLLYYGSTQRRQRSSASR